jgi:hypothetical protein
MARRTYESEHVGLVDGGREGVDGQEVPPGPLQSIFLGGRQLRVGGVVLMVLLLDEHQALVRLWRARVLEAVVELRAVDLAAEQGELGAAEQLEAGMRRRQRRTRECGNDCGDAAGRGGGDGRAVGPRASRRCVGVVSAIEAVAGVDVGLFEALLQRVDVCAQMAIVVLETIGVASCGGAAGDAVGGLALGVRVDAGAAASGLGVALDLADLAGRLGRLAGAAQGQYLAAIAGLAGPGRRLESLVDGSTVAGLGVAGETRRGLLHGWDGDGERIGMFRGRAEEIRGGSRRTGQDTQDRSRKSRHQRSRQCRHTADTASVKSRGGSTTWACREGAG